MMRGSNAPGLPRRASSESAAAMSAASASASASQQRQAEQREHALRAVEEREAFLGFERDGRDSGALHGVARRREISPLKFGAAFADDDLREVRERREIAGSSDRTLRGNYWMDSGVEHCAESFDDLRGGCR